MKGDINDFALARRLVEDTDALVNFAAETHIDRSISNPRAFHETNTKGALNLPEAYRLHHLVRLDHLLANVRRALKDDELLLLNEYVGESRFQEASVLPENR
jgi:dTDP-D-glucose 4,6-dehydratase